MLRTLILLTLLIPQVRTTVRYGTLAPGKCETITINHSGVRRGGEYDYSVDGDDTDAGYSASAGDGYLRVWRCAPTGSSVGAATVTITVSVPQ